MLGRLSNTSDTKHSVAENAVAALKLSGESLYIAPQNLIEFRSIATRAIEFNGLGYDVASAESEIARFENLFLLLPETPAIYPAWKTLVMAAGTVSKQVS